MMSCKSLKKTLAIASVTLLTGLVSAPVFADGTEVLGAPLGITVSGGTGTVAAGVGLRASQPGVINLNVPGTVNQALLYWHVAKNATDTVISVDNGGGAVDVPGMLIGGPSGSDHEAYRADITSMVVSGANSLTVGGLDPIAFGAGLLVIYDDGSDPAEIEIRDGIDQAYINDPAPLDATVPQTFIFSPADAPRLATLDMFFSSVSGTGSGLGFRPNAINITVGGVTDVLDNLLDSNDGEEWDTLGLTVEIPAGATMLTVEAESVDNLGIGGTPASFAWSAAGLSVPPGTQDEGLCWITGGGFIDLIDNDSAGQKTFSFGGNVGAPPHGSWQVTDHVTGDKFHSQEVHITSCEVLVGTTGPGQPGGKNGFDKNKANFAGIGALNGVGGCPFVGYVIDAGEPQGKKSNSNDEFHLETTDTIACGGDFSVHGEMPGGNFQIHPPVGKP